MRLCHEIICTAVTELQKEKRKLESKGNLKEVAAVCNKIGELLSRLGMLSTCLLCCCLLYTVRDNYQNPLTFVDILC